LRLAYKNLFIEFLKLAINKYSLYQLSLGLSLSDINTQNIKI